MPTYDFTVREDRLRYAMELPGREWRAKFRALIKRDYGAQAEQELVSDVTEAFEKRKRSVRVDD